MDSYTLFCNLKKILESTRIKKAYVIAADEMNIVDLTSLPLVICQNDQKKQENGSHWVCFYVYEQNARTVADFWDSLGKSPQDYGLTTPFRIVNRNTYKLQCDKSESCALFCIYFLWKRCKGNSFEKIHSSFSSSCKANDKKVYSFYKRFKPKNICKITLENIV